MIVIFTVLRLIVQVICHALVIAAETRGHLYKFVQLIAGFGQAFHKLGYHLRGLSLPPPSIEGYVYGEKTERVKLITNLLLVSHVYWCYTFNKLYVLL